MKRKTPILLFLLSLPVLLPAQHKLEKATTLPRSGDAFVKTEMEYFLTEAGESREKRAKKAKQEKKSWNIRQLEERKRTTAYKLQIKTGSESRESTVEETRPEYTVSHSEYSGGRLLSRESNTLYLRRFSSDSLIEEGYETPRVRVRYHAKPLLMKFPMEPDDEYTTLFSGRGTKDDRIASVHLGALTATVDAFGELVLPRGDTLASVVRIHEQREEQIYYESLSGQFDIEAPVNRDSLEAGGEPDERIRTDIYRWYEEGCRYPVFETVRSDRILTDNILPLREDSYLYLPYEQEFLEQDTANEKIRSDKRKKKTEKGKAKETGHKVRPIEYSLYPNPVTEALHVKFATQKGAETIVSLYELSGREVLRQVYPAENGYRNETWPMGAYPAGTYILRIACADEYVAQQIVKR
jgi:hypothetical protein